MRKSVGFWIALVLVTIVAVLPGRVVAAELLAGSSVVIGASERLNDDLYAAGNTIEIGGEVTRDVFAAGSTVIVSGRVGGDVTAAAGTIRVTGPVAGSVRVAGGEIDVTAPVGWDLAVLGAGSVTVGRTATIGHDVAIIGAGTVTIDGTVRGSVKGTVGTLIVNGQIEGDIDIEADRVELRDHADVRGALRYRAPQPASIAPGARIAGPQEYTPTPGAEQRERESFARRALEWIGTVLLRLAWALVVGTLLVLALPRQTARVAETLRVAPLASLLWGVGLLVGVPILAIVLAVTVVGLPAALFVLGFYIAVLYLSQVLVGIALVQLLPFPALRAERRLTLWLIMLVGTTVVLLFRMLPIPFGWTFWWSLVVGLLGLGMVWTAFSGIGLPKRTAVAAMSSAPASQTSSLELPEEQKPRASTHESTEER
ncbi:hypothetical protein NET03_03980 [Thermomicrobium sp. CFH 73360]|uniref:hypothetical protein n=1 Tax=Thermomicrobium sp. CFH 73360 TaxID=2951987 RepID=UPI0020767646|nr:hypothetical protein [Thermomicrobium sp. CFH 73360]MCM8745683.1 hypothetical protein [Thermomicrobium sp. CFH 73360]